MAWQPNETCMWGVERVYRSGFVYTGALEYRGVI